MEKSIVSVMASVLLAAVFGGCNYESPFVEAEDAKSIDAALLGVWQSVPAEDAKEGETHVALILKSTESMYMIQYPVRTDDTMYFLGTNVEIAGNPYLQVQLVGTERGPVKDADRKYGLLRYSVDGDDLELRMLNNETVADTGGTEALVQAFTDKKDDPALFRAAIKFRRKPAGQQAHGEGR